MAKVVKQVGIYPNDNSSRKAVAKRDLRSLCPIKRWGQFVLDVGRFRNLVVNKITIKERDLINSL